MYNTTLLLNYITQIRIIITMEVKPKGKRGRKPKSEQTQSGFKLIEIDNKLNNTLENESNNYIEYSNNYNESNNYSEYSEYKEFTDCKGLECNDEYYNRSKKYIYNIADKIAESEENDENENDSDTNEGTSNQKLPTPAIVPG